MARITKKNVYHSYGIEFNGDKILSPVGWISPLLKNGNDKVGKTVWTWSTLPGTGVFDVIVNGKSISVQGTCCCDCDGCYAKTGRYNCDNVIKSNAINTIIAREYLDFMKRAIMAQIKADKIQLLRIHAAGDFFSIEYINVWREIKIAYPNVISWTYTKNEDAENAFDDIPNCNIVKSVVSGFGYNFGHCDYILALYEYLVSIGKSVYICRCGIDKNQHCNKCTGCSKFDYVLFIEHSTNYIAENDPLFPVLYALIMSQNNDIAGC